MLHMGHSAYQEAVGEVGWTIGRIMEALIISAKAAYSNPQDQVLHSTQAILEQIG